jgi:hypothetical protein
MMLQLVLPQELDERLRLEANRRGQAPASLALELLEQCLPPIDEINERIRAAKSLTELFTTADAITEPDDSYDLFKALDENRKGQRPLFPPELKGVSW